MTTAINTISTTGKALVDSSGSRFMVRGVTLSSAGADLLSDDYHDYVKTYVIPQFVYLNVNTVRVYSVDESVSHKKVMDLLAKYHIYAMVSVVNSAVCVDRMEPYYSLAMYQRMTKIASEFCSYSNTLSFEVGNEVVFPGDIYASTQNNATLANQIITNDAATIKSMISDLKGYISSNGLRAVLVGMAMQDGPTSTLKSWGGIGTDIVAEYYACGDPSQAADYIGINTYRYIPGGPMTSYDGLANEVLTIPVPVILTETGGNSTNPPTVVRDWLIVPQMYSEELLYNNLSGQIAYDFFEEGNGFGLYNDSPAPSKGPVTTGTLEATTFGGAANLSTEFGDVVSNVPPMPSSVPTPSSCPAGCNPPLIGSLSPNTSITIQNYYTGTDQIVVVQGKGMIATLSPATEPSNPTSTPLMVSNQRALYILDQSQDWALVCKVSPSNITNGVIIKNNTSWGGACNVESMP